MTAEDRYKKRERAVIAVQDGESPEAVARILGTTCQTIYNWLARYRNGGLQNLRDKKGNRGRPTKLTAKEIRMLYRAIVKTDPRQYEFECCLWSLPVIRAFIKQQFGVELAKSSIWHLLRRLGLSPQMSVFRSYKRDKKATRKFPDKTVPPLIKKSKKFRSG